MRHANCWRIYVCFYSVGAKNLELESSSGNASEHQQKIQIAISILKGAFLGRSDWVQNDEMIPTVLLGNMSDSDGLPIVSEIWVVSGGGVGVAFSRFQGGDFCTGSLLDTLRRSQESSHHDDCFLENISTNLYRCSKCSHRSLLFRCPHCSKFLTKNFCAAKCNMASFQVFRNSVNSTKCFRSSWGIVRNIGMNGRIRASWVYTDDATYRVRSGRDSNCLQIHDRVSLFRGSCWEGTERQSVPWTRRILFWS